MSYFSDPILRLSTKAPESVSSAFTATTATLHATPGGLVPTSSPSKFWLALFAIYSSITFINRISFLIIRFTTFTLPTWLFTLFSMSLTVTMNFTTLLLIVLCFISGVVWVVRYRFLNMYSRLPPEPQRKEPEIDLFPDSQEGDSKPGLSNYLDEFLSAIKIFGYLERPVFHELTRHMQTRRLIAGETFMLEEEKGFCMVVDGLVQIFVKANRSNDCSLEHVAGAFGGKSETHDSLDIDFHDEEGEDGAQGYQLLTEVKNGAPMSSLFTILSLFTEDVKLRHEMDEDGGNESSESSAPGLSRMPSTRMGMADPMLHSPTTPRVSRPASSGELRMHQGGREVDGIFATPHMQTVPPMSLNNEGSVHSSPTPHTRPVTPLENTHFSQSHLTEGPGSRPLLLDPSEQPKKRPKLVTRKSVHPDIIARASVDTTIAVIPAVAFRRLTRIYPKATAHIVQVILTRFQRVTFLTGYSYLGLTSEVLQTEKFMNKYTMYELPNYLRGYALERLKEKFKSERERTRPEDQIKGIVLHNPAALFERRRKSSSAMRKEAFIHAKLAAARGAPPQVQDVKVTPSYGNSAGSLGDISTNIFHRENHLSPNYQNRGTSEFGNETREAQTPLGLGFNPFARLHSKYANDANANSANEDVAFREAVLECIFKAIGLTQQNSARPRGEAESVDQSPRLLSLDSKRQKTTFSNAFGFIDPFEGSIDGDTESQASTTISAASTSGGLFSPQSDLKNEIEIVFFPKGAVLVEQGERNPGLYYVIDGFLDVSVPVDEKKRDKFMNLNMGAAEKSVEELPILDGSATLPPYGSESGYRSKGMKGRKSLFMIKPGGIAGYIGSISAYRSFIDVRAKTDVYVGFLPREALERIVEKYPVVLLTMAKRLTSLLPRLILHIDFALEWVQINAGQVIYHQGDESDAIYIVLNGRLRAVLEDEKHQMHGVGEYGQGESVGELEVLTESSRPATVHAIRDTELARFPRTLFNSLALEHPGITIQISKIIASRMRALIGDPLKGTGFGSYKDYTGTPPSRRRATTTENLRTVCILPVTAGVPVTDFSHRLSNALTQVGTPNGVTILNQAVVLNHLGRHAFSRMGKLKLSGYLADLEEKFGLVLYVADTSVNAPWTQTCISQADCILVVGVADASPNIGEYERFLVGMKSTARKELVLLHTERYCPPGLTRQWLRNRIWINGRHHHIQMSPRTSSEPIHSQAKRFSSAFKQRVQTIQAEIQRFTSRRLRTTPIYSSETPFKGDFHRLARRLCGKSVGLVLGGGGARGIAHVGVIRALEEAGIPIDIVGGTSIGAFCGALYARDADIVPVYGRAKRFASRMGSLWRFVLDLTYPSISYTTGHEFNRGIFKTFGNSQIEDFWLEFYCNTTDISNSRMEIHTSGYAWRYVRASMSLAGLLPPLCDEGSMLLDGGYVDNLTVAHMKSLGADTIFAINVGSVDDQTPQHFGDSLSGFWALWNKWNPFSAYPNPPTLAEIQARLAYVSSVDALERAKIIPGCVYMRPPIEGYATLDFGKFDEIYQVGYEYGKRFLEELKGQRGGVIPGQPPSEEKGVTREVRRTMAPRRASI